MTLQMGSTLTRSDRCRAARDFYVLFNPLRLVSDRILLISGPSCGLVRLLGPNGLPGVLVAFLRRLFSLRRTL